MDPASPAPVSPFRKDEPVTRSWKWMLLLLPAQAAWLFLVIRAWIVRFDVSDLLFLIAAAALPLAALLFLIRTVRTTAPCRHHRSFDMMGRALRSQRACWMVLLLAAGVTSGLFVTRALQARGILDALEKAVQAQRAHPRRPAAP